MLLTWLRSINSLKEPEEQMAGEPGAGIWGWRVCGVTGPAASTCF